MTTAQPPLVLTSASTSRASRLQGTESTLDENGVKQELRRQGTNGLDLCATSNETKAQSVIEHAAGWPAIGADQVLVVGDAAFDKPVDRVRASDQPESLRGRWHALISGTCVLQASEPARHSAKTVRIGMRWFSEILLETHLECIGAAALTGARAEQAEGLGIQLFETIEGCHTTIFSLPLLPLFEVLRSRGVVMR